MGDDLLSAERVAALVAPVIDRLRLSIAGALQDEMGPRAARYGLEPPALGVLARLRNTVPDRVVARPDVHAVLRYTPAAQVDGALDAAVAAGLLAVVDHAAVVLTPAGVALMDDIAALTAGAADGRWAAHDDLVQRLLELSGPVLDVAVATGGPAMRVIDRPPEPAGATPAYVLAERLTSLRFHRFDAHIAAWEAAGLTLAEVQALGPGDQRDAIEADTNRRAASPYEALEPAERVELLAGLGALPG